MLVQYFLIFKFFIFSLFLAILLYTLSYFLVKQKPYADKVSSYECGFAPYDDARKVFRVSFYLYALIFMIFDLESVFIFPWVKTFPIQTSFGFWIMIDFLIELIIGYVYIWLVGALNQE